MLREDDDDADGRGDTCTDRDDNADTIWSEGVNDAEEDCVGEDARDGTGSDGTDTNHHYQIDANGPVGFPT